MRLFRQPFFDKATGKRKLCAKWTVEFRDHHRIARRWPLFKDKGQSMRAASRIVRLVECRGSHSTPDEDLRRWIESLPTWLRDRLLNAQIIDRRQLASDRTLLQHLEGDAAGDTASDHPSFKRYLTDKGSSPAHVAKTVGRVRRVFTECGFAYWSDLAEPGALARVTSFLAKLRTGDEATIGSTTASYIVKHLKQFGRWVCKHGGAGTDHLAQLESVEHAGVDKIEWRALSVDEMRWLIRTTAAEKVTRFNVGAGDRALVYRFTFESGIRAGQLRKLLVSSFDLTADPPTFTSLASSVKRRVRHVQIVKPATATQLAERFRTKMPAAAAFDLPTEWSMADMLRRDLAAARAAWIKAAGEDAKEGERRGRSDFLADVNHRGQKVVFHSLRHSHGTALGNAGIAQRAIQDSLHHASGRVTERYLHTGTAERILALDALPDLSGEAVAATGTDGAGAGGNFQPDSNLQTCIPLDSGGKNGRAGEVESAVLIGSARIRTENQGIMSPHETGQNANDSGGSSDFQPPCQPNDLNALLEMIDAFRPNLTRLPEVLAKLLTGIKALCVADVE